MKTSMLLKQAVTFFALLLMGAFSVYGNHYNFEDITIQGKITDAESGDALIGVNVLVRGTLSGTVTDFDGTFKITTSKNPPLELEIS